MYRPTPELVAATQAELNVLLTEYKSLRDDVLSTMNHTRQVLHIGILAAGAVAAVPRYTSEASDGTAIFLATASFIFYGTVFAFLRYVYLQKELVSHIGKVIAPLIRDKLRILHGTEDPIPGVMTWEQKAGGRGPARRKQTDDDYSFLEMPIPLSPILMHLVFALVTFGVAFQLGLPEKHPSSWKWLAAAHIGGVLYVGFISWKIGRRSVPEIESFSSPGAPTADQLPGAEEAEAKEGPRS